MRCICQLLTVVLAILLTGNLPVPPTLCSTDRLPCQPAPARTCCKPARCCCDISVPASQPARSESATTSDISTRDAAKNFSAPVGWLLLQNQSNSIASVVSHKVVAQPVDSPLYVLTHAFLI